MEKRYYHVRNMFTWVLEFDDTRTDQKETEKRIIQAKKVTVSLMVYYGIRTTNQ